MHDDDHRLSRILIIDDNRAIHDDFQKILGKEIDSEMAEAEAAFFGEAPSSSEQPTYEINHAYQGEEGLDMLVRGMDDDYPYDMAFVDMRMPPGWDGVETIEHLWQRDPGLQIVICTAYSDYSWSEIIDRLGQSDRLLILKKPFDNIEVSQLAAALTEKSHLARQAQMKMSDLEEAVERRTNELREKDDQLRQKQALESIGSLAGGVAHEFNNLLQVIQGFTQFAINGLCDEDPVRVDLAQVLLAAERAADITGQLLAFSRRRPVKKEPCECNDIVRNLAEVFRPLLGEQIDLQLSLSEEPYHISADRGVLEQVLMNLCINARDAMPSGGKLTLSTAPFDASERRGTGIAQDVDLPPGPYLKLSVSDTGCGMAEDVRRSIFDPFFTTKEVGKGTGLGLTMVYGAIQQHGGAISVQSQPGEGSTFGIYLPVMKCTAERKKTLPHAIGSGNGETILVAEDDPIVREVTVRTLHDAGYRTITVADGQQAVDTFLSRKNEIELLLFDAIMPHMTGHEAYQRIKDVDADVPVIFCTGYDPDTYLDNTFLDDGFTLVQKPCSRDDLLRAVAEALDDCQPSAIKNGPEAIPAEGTHELGAR